MGIRGTGHEANTSTAGILCSLLGARDAQVANGKTPAEDRTEHPHRNSDRHAPRTIEGARWERSAFKIGQPLFKNFWNRRQAFEPASCVALLSV